MNTNDSFSKRTLILLCAVCVLILIGVFWLFSPKDQQANFNSKSSQIPSNPTTVNAVNADPAQAHLKLSKSLEGTEINCEFRLDGANQLIVNTQTRDCFEYFLTQIGEKDLSLILNEVKQYLNHALTEPARSQAIDLWQRYYQYREQLQHLQASGSAEAKGSQYYRSIFQSMQQLRQQFFSASEIEGLFGVEDVYHLYTLDRMDIMDNDALSEAEKAQQLKDRFAELPAEWQENLQQMSQLDDLRRLTAEIKARGGNASDIRQMRLNLVGPEATQRLEQLDQQRATWKTKVERHLNERDAILNSNLDQRSKQKALVELRQKNFPENHEQLRVQTFETVHDQGQPLPFPETLE